MLLKTFFVTMQTGPALQEFRCALGVIVTIRMARNVLSGCFAKRNCAPYKKFFYHAPFTIPHSPNLEIATSRLVAVRCKDNQRDRRPETDY
jgi:hypothetical protein